MATYSFQDTSFTITGFGGSISLGSGSGSSEEGITIESIEDKNIMNQGADGFTQHSLIASRAATVTVRLLKTSPVNGTLQQMYNLQTASALTHGKNVITGRDIARGDFIVLSKVAFAKEPTVTYAKEAGMIEWLFHCGTKVQVLGQGDPEK
jgi:hypothetical protein